MSGSISLGLHFVKQAAPSVTLTCNIYPECTEFATIIKSNLNPNVRGGGWREVEEVEEVSLLNGGNGCWSPRRVFVALRK